MTEATPRPYGTLLLFLFWALLLAAVPRHSRWRHSS